MCVCVCVCVCVGGGGRVPENSATATLLKLANSLQPVKMRNTALKMYILSLSLSHMYRLFLINVVVCLA